MARLWLTGVLVLGVAAVVRVPHYDVMMFAGDQVSLMAQARQVLAGRWDVMGPDAAGLDIVGPLYTYLLAGTLWVRNDPTLAGLLSVSCDVVAAWFVYDAALRLSVPAAAFAAAATYILAPVLALSTRIIWNPSLLPPLVALGWWLVVCHCQRPLLTTSAGIGLVAGLAPMVHATGVFHGVALLVAAVVTKPLSLRRSAVAVATGALPLALVLPRLTGGSSDVGALGDRIVVMELWPTLTGLAHITLGFPTAAVGQHWTAVTSSAAVQVQVLVGALGLAAGLIYRGPFRPLWLGLAGSLVLNMGSAFVYSGHLSWYYFMALTPGLCLGLASAIGRLPRMPTQMAIAAVALASAHVPFLTHFDEAPVRSGFINVPAAKLMLRVPAAGPAIHFPTLRDLNLVGSALRSVIPDGATAMQAAHGSRGELWRETGAEFLPPGAAPRNGWRTEFLLMGPGARAMAPHARLIDNRVCAFERSSTSWRIHHRPDVGWEQPAFADQGWATVNLPRRVAGPSLAGPSVALAAWQAPYVALRSRFEAEPGHPRRFGLTIRSAPYSQHRIASLHVNGTPAAPSKERVVHSVFARTHEWVIELEGLLVAPGWNTLAVAVDGQMPQFDLDVFDVPCLDREWYY